MEEVIVSVVQGKLKGKISTDYAGNKFYSFQGIPYAKPPVGNLRFKVIFQNQNFPIYVGTKF